jgi:16S rRNA (guanine1516-N2)-methyltransferase
MGLKLIKDGIQSAATTPEELRLADYCQLHQLDVSLEWIQGQYWWHSNRLGENPIGVNIDQELQRHHNYFRQHSIHKELLARAIGVKASHRPEVIDLTAGLLGDSLLMLSFGCQVLAVERHPIVSLLIESALNNAHHGALERFEFLPSDGLTVLSDQDLTQKTLYFDPMFSEVNDKALPRKEMRIFRELVGKDLDAENVITSILSRPYKRLVVKRPRLAVELAPGVSIKFEGKATRYDVYLGQNTRPFESNPLK